MLITAIRLSTRSNTPPCPGSRLLLSLIPAARLSQLSSKSPHTLTTVKIKPIKIVFNQPASKASQPAFHTMVMYTATHNAPPIAPSQLLPGLMVGAILRLPNDLPQKYAPISATHTKPIIANKDSASSG